jgi:ubiquinone/menaquinone biosynthesis C-methylase UbiE
MPLKAELPMSVYNKLSRISRLRKWQLFQETFAPDEHTRILDVGGEVSQGEESLQFLDLYPWKANLTTVNISENHIKRIQEKHPQIDARVGDACCLPWDDKCFDIVFSNAVIEHVGSAQKQKQMAEEIVRVGRQWFVTTPNRLYPFEFHMRLPFVTWLPFHGYLKFGRLISYNHVKKKYAFGLRHENLRLMTAKELATCFPDSRIIKQKVTFMAETLIAIGPPSEIRTYDTDDSKEL